MMRAYSFSTSDREGREHTVRKASIWHCPALEDTSTVLVWTPMSQAISDSTGKAANRALDVDHPPSQLSGVYHEARGVIAPRFSIQCLHNVTCLAG